MEVIKAKEYLSQALWINKRIDSKLEQASTLRSLAMKVTTTFGEDKVMSNRKQSPQEEVLVKLIDLENEINDDIDKFIDLKKEITEVIQKVNDIKYRLILEMRYINGKDWDEVAINIGYDTRWVMRLHGKALKEIDEIINFDH